MKQTYVIAEAGSCHDGDLQYATELVAIARDTGCDAIKFQYWSDPDQLAERRRVPEKYRAIYRHYAMPADWVPTLAEVARLGHLDFMCTAYLPQDVAVLAPAVRHFKVASFEAQAWDLIEAHIPYLKQDRNAGRDRWLVMSRGMGADHASGIPSDLLQAVKFLLCTSAYPAPLQDLNLRRFHLSSALDEDVLDGFSDHSEPAYTWTGALAVAAGAEIVEAHVKHPRTAATNPDAPHAMSWPQLRDYVAHIRFAERTLGDGRMAERPSERPMMAYKVRNP